MLVGLSCPHFVASAYKMIEEKKKWGQSRKSGKAVTGSRRGIQRLERKQQNSEFRD
jgi:hypothetical protein